MSNLAGITNQAVRSAMGTRSLTAANLAIHGSNSENCLTTAAVVHTIDGKFQTNFAIASEIDLSALSVVDANGNSLDSVVTMPAIAAGGDSRTKVYILACIGTTAYIVEPEVDVAAAQTNSEESLKCPDGYAPFGTIKVVQSPTDAAGSALFTLGTTDMTGITNQTVTFGSISLVPPTVSDVA